MTPRTRIAFLKLLPVLLLALAFTLGCRQAQTPPKAAQAAPDFTLPDLGGNQVTLSLLRGRPVLLNFWSTT